MHSQVCSDMAFAYPNRRAGPGRSILVTLGHLTYRTLLLAFGSLFVKLELNQFNRELQAATNDTQNEERHTLAATKAQWNMRCHRKGGDQLRVSCCAL